MARNLIEIPCVILAGGKGTRLQSVLSDIPKPMAPIGNQPFIKHLLDKLFQQGLQHFILSVGYQKDIIIQYFNAINTPYSIQFVEEEKPLGTGGAISAAISTLQTEYALIINGDTLFDIHYHSFVEQVQKLGVECGLALHRIQHGTRYGEVTLNGAIISSFSEKKEVNNGLINGGVYLLNIAKYKLHAFPQTYSFEKDYLEQFVNEQQFAGIEMKGYFIDIGIPEDYIKAQHELTH